MSTSPVRLFGLFFFIPLFLWAQSAQAPSAPDTNTVPFEGHITVDDRISSPEVNAGDTLIYTVSLSWNSPNENYAFWPPETPQIKGLKFSHMQTTNEKRSTQAGYESKTTFHLFFIGETPGEGEIGSSQIKYLSRGSKDFEYLHLKSRSITVKPRPREFPFAILIKGLIILALSICFGLLYYRNYKKKKAKYALEHPLSPKEQTLKYLTECKKVRLEGEVADYYEEIGNIIKSYLVRTGVLPQEKKSFSQILEALETSSFTPSVKSSFVSVLKTCEEIRFSGIVPEPGEIDLFETKVKNIFKEIE